MLFLLKFDRTTTLYKYMLYNFTDLGPDQIDRILLSFSNASQK